MVGKKEKQDDFDFDALTNELEQQLDAEDNDVDLNAVGQAIDTTFGRSSTPKTSQFSVKFQLDVNYNLIASYCAIVNFVGDKEQVIQKRSYSEESVKVIDMHLKAVKERYKSICGKTLTTTEIATNDSVEIIGMTFHSQRRTAYMRRKTVYNLS